MSTNGTGEIVTLTIDGKEVKVPKGTNLIDAAKEIGVEIPHYCYHPHLSIAGNCRMCQMQVKGRPKLEIGCNTAVAEGMEVSTHCTSKEVAAAQAATLEFILINHPLDCTVCDQAGHCKLQDYHFEYNAKSSRFVEEKEHKVKAEVLGPNVILDGERCIMCTRCIRFCDEITGTSELGMLNRGDRSVIAISNGRELDNELSGTVVDLCPVGALTHRNWRFNTRIWFTKQTESICTGCSTGCNVKVAARDGEIVNVKARLNDHVNKEWLCDEGRYGFMRFLPETRVTAPISGGRPVSLGEALASAKNFVGEHTWVFVSPDLTLEDYAVLKTLLDTRFKKGYSAVVAYRERKLSKVEQILVSPDYAANFRGAQFAGLAGEKLQADYEEALGKIRAGTAKNVVIIGDRGILKEDQDASLLGALGRADHVFSLLTDAASPLYGVSKVVLPARSILERSGLLLNRDLRLQYTDAVVQFPDGTEPVWRLLNSFAKELGGQVFEGASDRDATLWLLGHDARLAGHTIRSVKAGGVLLKAAMSGAQSGEARA